MNFWFGPPSKPCPPELAVGTAKGTMRLINDYFDHYYSPNYKPPRNTNYKTQRRIVHMKLREFAYYIENFYVVYKNPELSLQIITYFWRNIKLKQDGWATKKFMLYLIYGESKPITPEKATRLLQDSKLFNAWTGLQIIRVLQNADVDNIFDKTVRSIKQKTINNGWPCYDEEQKQEIKQFSGKEKQAMKTIMKLASIASNGRTSLDMIDKLFQSINLTN